MKNKLFRILLFFFITFIIVIIINVSKKPDAELISEYLDETEQIKVKLPHLSLYEEHYKYELLNQESNNIISLSERYQTTYYDVFIFDIHHNGKVVISFYIYDERADNSLRNSENHYQLKVEIEDDIIQLQNRMVKRWNKK